LDAAGLKTPAVLITAEDVSHGKPDPEGYTLAATRLGFPVQECLIFEDSAAGIEAAVRAAATVLVVTETHTNALTTSNAHTANYTSLAAVPDSSGGLLLKRQD
jgi:sugar-phosphatase